MITVLGIVSSIFNNILFDEILPYKQENTLKLVIIVFLGINVSQVVVSFVRQWMMMHLSIKIDIGVSVVLATIGIGFGVSSIVWFIKNSVKGLVVAGLKRAVTSAVVALGFSIGSGLYGILTSINPNWTIGYGIANYIDNHESGKKRGNGVVFG